MVKIKWLEEVIYLGDNIDTILCVHQSLTLDKKILNIGRKLQAK